MRKDDYVKVVGVDGKYRFGYIANIKDKGDLLEISLYEEGKSKIAYDASADAFCGKAAIDYVSLLTDIEKRMVPLLAAGYNTNDIAQAMSITASTVRAHLRTLRIKLYLDNREQLIAFSQALTSMIAEQEEALA